MGATGYCFQHVSHSAIQIRVSALSFRKHIHLNVNSSYHNQSYYGQKLPVQRPCLYTLYAGVSLMTRMTVNV